MADVYENLDFFIHLNFNPKQIQDVINSCS